MADKSFGVKELNLLNASGTPTVTSPNNLNLNANTVAISTSCTIGNNLTVTSTTNSANLNVTGIGTLTRAFATDLSVSGVTTITVPANANPHSSWDVVNNSASAYRFTGPGQDGAEDNPNIYLVRGQRYVFKMNASGHPFQIRVANAGAAYSDGVTNNGSQTGNVVFNVQHDAPAQLFYQCTSHGSMVGNIYIVGGPQVISGVVTATTFVGNLTGNVTGTASANAVLTGSTNNQLVTVTGANAITGESALTFDGSTLNLTSASGDARVTLIGTEGNDARLSLVSDDGDDHIDQYNLRVDASDNSFYIDQFESGSFVERFRISNGGNVMMGVTSSSNRFHVEGTTTGSRFGVDDSASGITALAITNETNADLETVIYTNKASLGSSVNIPICFHTNGKANEKLRITSGGNLMLRSAAANYLVMGSSGDSGFGATISNNMNWIRGNADNLQMNTATGGFMGFEIGGSEKFRIGSSGQYGIGGGNYGTAGQVIKSTGASSAPVWASGGRAIQYSSDYKTAEQNTSSSSWQTISGLARTVTPKNANSRFLLLFMATGQTNGGRISLDIDYNATGITNDRIGNSLGEFAMMSSEQSSGQNIPLHMHWVHHPNTANAVTYTPQFRSNGSNTVIIGASNHPAHFTVIELEGF